MLKYTMILLRIIYVETSCVKYNFVKDMIVVKNMQVSYDFVKNNLW